MNTYSVREAATLIGRYVTTNDGCKFAFSGTQIILTVENCSALSICLCDEFGNNCFSIIIDGNEAAVMLRTKAGRHEYQLPSPVDLQKHEYRIIKRTEGRCGEVELVHISASVHTVFHNAAQGKHKILFIGDSITCGYGVLAADQYCSFVSEEEDVLRSFAGLTASAFAADAHFICYSGKGIYRNWGDELPFQNTMLEIVHRILPHNPELLYDWSAFVPDCIVIALGSNDLGYPSPIDLPAFRQAYLQFVQMVAHKQGGRVPLFCVNSPSLPSAMLKVMQETISEAQTQIPEVQYVAQARQSIQQGFGADWHPSAKQAKINAKELTAAIQTAMNWEIVNPII